MEEKTNVMRILDKHKIVYTKHTYDASKAISGVEVADFLGQDYNRTFKTLVTVRKIWRTLCFCNSSCRRARFEKSCKNSGRKKHRNG